MYGLISQLFVAAGQRDQLMSILAHGSKDMAGCVSYVVAADRAREDSVWITEVWRDAESHRASLTLPSVQAAIAQGRPLIKGIGIRIETTPFGPSAGG